MTDGTDPNLQTNQDPAVVIDDKPQMPAGLDASFWDGEKGAVKTEDLIKSHGDLSKFKTEYDATFRKV
jgi:hypothetical protein